MRKSFGVLALVVAFTGCSSVRQMLSPFWGPAVSDTTLRPLITPAFLLSGRAARHQDSLLPQLKFLQSCRAPSGLTLQGLSFRNAPDSSVQLLAEYGDDRRLNSHGLTPEQTRERQNQRILAQRPLWIFVRQAKLDHPVVIRSTFRSRDFIFQNARMVTDTAEVVLPDTVAKPQK